MADAFYNEDGQIVDPKAAQVLAYKEKDLRDTESRLKVEQESESLDPIPGVMKALRVGVQVGKNNLQRMGDHLTRYAQSVHEAVESESRIEGSKVEAAEALLKKREIEENLSLERLGDNAQIPFMVQDVVPTLRALGLISHDIPDTLPDGKENEYLAKLLTKDGDTKIEERSLLRQGGNLVIDEYTKATNLPGVSFTVGMFRGRAGTHGYPLVNYECTRFQFSPKALSAM